MRIFDTKIQMTDKFTTDSFGFKTFKDVVIARSGTQDYLESELVPNGAKDKIVTVQRKIADVLKSIESINGKPIVNLHPDKDMEFNSLPSEIIGVAMNARMEDGKVLADLLFYKDFDNIEISLGYDANIRKVNNEYVQTDIEVNHIAIVPKGRCGKLCKIIDKGITKMGKITIKDKSFEVDDKVQAQFDAVTAENELLKEKIKDAKSEAMKEVAEKASLFKKAKEMKVEVEADAENIDIKRALVDAMPSLSSKDKSEDYLNAVIDVWEEKEYIPASVKDAQVKEDAEKFKIEVEF